MVRYIANNNEEETILEPSPGGYLVLLVNNRASQIFPLRDEVQLGRDKSNSVVVSDQKVSRFHASLAADDDTFILSDQGSANGTYLNGVLIAQPTRLKPKDRITIGDTTFLFTNTTPDNLDELVAEQAPPSPAPASAPPSSQDSQPNNVIDSLSNQPIWMVVGCLGLIIVALLLALAVLLGLMIGRGQMAAGMVLMQLLSLL